MGFLDDLKRQADAAKAQQTTDTGVLDRNALLTDAACTAALRYFTTLAQQLNVLQPRSKVTYRLDKRHTFSGLQLCDFRADSRMKKLRGGDVFDFVSLSCKLKGDSPERTIEKDFPPEVEKIEARLRQSGATYSAEPIRNAENGRWRHTRFAFTPEFAVGVRVKPDHDSGWVRFQLTNLDGFETVTLELPSFEIGSARLDELARWLVGEPNSFAQDAENLRRVEA